MAFSLTRQFGKRRQATISAVKSWLAHCTTKKDEWKRLWIASCLLFTKSTWTAPLEFSLFTKDFFQLGKFNQINFSLTWKDSYSQDFNYIHFSCLSFQLWFSWTKPYVHSSSLWTRTYFVMTSFFPLKWNHVMRKKFHEGSLFIINRYS